MSREALKRYWPGLILAVNRFFGEARLEKAWEMMSRDPSELEEE